MKAGRVGVTHYAKITRPQVLDVYPRRRLFRLLKTCLKDTSLWVEGAAGSGKTTLVNNFLEIQGTPCLWYRFDERDTDISNFFYYLGKAAEVATDGQGQPLPLLTPEYLLDVPVFARNFFDQLYEQLKMVHTGQASGICTIVFDDYHLISPDSSLHHIIELALSELTDDIRLIFLSRNPLPPALASAHANRKLAVIGREALGLTLDETEGIVRHLSKRHDVKALSQALHECTHGWVAGLILLWEHVRREGDDASWRRQTPASMRDYFAETLFNSLDEELKDFLLKSAILPFMTAEMAARLTGCSDAARILEELHRNNFFTEKRQTDNTTYLYHTLFREFLLAHAREILTAVEFTQLQKMAGVMLREGGYDEQAAAMFQEARDWASLAQLIKEKAQELLQQGRGRLLESWLETMPESRLNTDPWLQYWLGSCHLYVKPQRARGHFETAYHRFTQREERAGQYLAWVAIVETGFLVWDFGFLRGWIETMEQLLAEEEGFPSPEIAARVTMAMFLALMFSAPWQEKIGIWAERLLQYVQACPDAGQKLQMGMQLVPYYSWMGQLEKMNTLIGILRPFCFENLSPLARLQHCIVEAYGAWFMGDWERCLEMVEQGLQISETSGIRVLDALLCAQGVYGALSQSDLRRGRVYLDRMQTAAMETDRTNCAHYYHLAAWHAALCGKRDEGIRHLRVSLELAERDGVVFPAACNHVELAGLLVENGAFDEAEMHLQQAQDISLRMDSLTIDIKCQLVQARLAWQRGEDEVARVALRKALGTAREQGFVNLPWWYSPMMAELCVKALENHIETDYACELVRKRRLVPAAPPVHLKEWPWELKIYTLGRFTVIKNGSPMQIGGKGQRMPFSLLKALIALGGRAVPEATLSEVLWPMADAEAAHSAFATTLSRLRRILGNADLLQVRDGCLSLNPCCCWVDTWSFERLMGEISANRSTLDLRQAEQALHLYHGGFLVDENTEAYAIFSMRERLREKYLQLVARLGEHYMALGRDQEAATCFERGLEVDDLVEQFYRNLMICYERLGRRARALRLYERCRKTLASRFGIMPSRETEAVHRGLLVEENSDQPQ